MESPFPKRGQIYRRIRPGDLVGLGFTVSEWTGSFVCSFPWFMWGGGGHQTCPSQIALSIPLICFFFLAGGGGGVSKKLRLPKP